MEPTGALLYHFSMYKLLIYFLILYISFTRCRLVPLFLWFFGSFFPFAHFFALVCTAVLVVPFSIFEPRARWTKCTVYTFCVFVHSTHFSFSIDFVFVISCVSYECSIVLSPVFFSLERWGRAIEWQIKQHDGWKRWMDSCFRAGFAINILCEVWNKGLR